MFTIAVNRLFTIFCFLIQRGFFPPFILHISDTLSLFSRFIRAFSDGIRLTARTTRASSKRQLLAQSTSIPQGRFAAPARRHCEAAQAAEAIQTRKSFDWIASRPAGARNDGVAPTAGTRRSGWSLPKQARSAATQTPIASAARLLPPHTPT